MSKLATTTYVSKSGPHHRARRPRANWKLCADGTALGTFVLDSTGRQEEDNTAGTLGWTAGQSVAVSLVEAAQACPSTTSAPRLDAVHPGDRGVAAVWTEPAGVTGITSYDIRYILTSADETVDANWTVVQDAWTEGALNARVTGLTNGTSYDFQVRAVTTVDGAWSASVAATPVEPGGGRSAAIALPFGVALPGELPSTSDHDWFRFTITETIGVLAWSRSDLDPYGTLHTSDRDYFDQNDDGRLADNPSDFLLWRTLAPGTYYLSVALHPAATRGGSYTVQLRTLADTTSISDAHEVQVGGAANGLIDPDKNDVDFFRFTLGSETDVILRTGAPHANTNGELLDSSGALIEAHDESYLPGLPRHFLIRRNLAAGTYYVKVGGSTRGLYSFHVDAVSEPGTGIAGAERLDFGEIAGGRIDSTSDVDYFRIDLTSPTWVFLRAVSNSVDIDGAVVDSTGNAVAANIFEEDYLVGEARGFTLSAELATGTHYLKIDRSGGADTGGYALRMIEDTSYDDVLGTCTALTAPFSDPLSGCQWHLRNTGQRGGTSGEDIRVETVWSGGNLGAGIGVAIVDDEVQGNHADLTDNFDTSRTHNYVPGGAGRANPLDDHGTHVAGIIAARDNALGGRGVAPRATIYGYNALAYLTSANGANAMTRNMSTTGVSNNSWGAPDGPHVNAQDAVWAMAVETGVTTGYGSKGVFYSWAAGNGGLSDDVNLSAHANHYAVTAVCAVNDRGQRTTYSEPGAPLWVCAPSHHETLDVLTTAPYHRYGYFGGTSTSAPIVSGVAALLRAANADLTWRDLKLILAASARKNDAANPGWSNGARKYGASGNYSFSHDYGFGVVDAKAATDLAAGWENLPAFLETQPVQATPGLVIPDASASGPGAEQTSTVTVGTEVEFIEFVEVTVGFTAPSFRDLRIELVSPSNTVSILSTPHEGDRYGIDPSHRFGSARHLGENPAGTWTLRVSDHVPTTTQWFNSWSLKGLRPQVEAATSSRPVREPRPAGAHRVLGAAGFARRVAGHFLRCPLDPQRRHGQGGQPLDAGHRRLDGGHARVHGDRAAGLHALRRPGAGGQRQGRGAAGPPRRRE